MLIRKQKIRNIVGKHVPPIFMVTGYEAFRKGGMIFNATFNHISVISCRSVLLVEKIEVPGENHWPAASHWQTLSHNVVYSTPHYEWNRYHKKKETRRKPKSYSCIRYTSVFAGIESSDYGLRQRRLYR
jgi:hypothetical protein